MLLSLAVGILALAIYIAASFVLARNSRSSINQSFSVFSFVIATWILANYIGANFKSYAFAQYFAHIDFFLGAFLGLSLWQLSLDLLTATEKSSKIIRSQEKSRIYAIVITTLVAFSTLVPSVLTINFDGGTTNTTTGMGFLAYSVVLLSLVILSVTNMILALRWARGELRQQISTMLSGLVLAVAFVAFSNLLVPFFTDSKSANLIIGNLSYVGVAIFVGATYYSVIKHKLFDLRLIIARTIAYTLMLGVLTASYIALAFLLSTFLIEDYTVSLQQTVITIAILLLLTATLNPIRKYFNRITNSIFYRDSYDTQEFLDQFNKTLVATFELKPLLEKASAIIEDNLKPTYCILIINATDTSGPRVVSPSRKVKISTQDFKTFSDVRYGSSQKVFITEELAKQYHSLERALRQQDAAVFARLAASYNAVNKEIGCLILGPKMSGNVYSDQDIGVLEIAANELVIAVQNALRFEEIQNFNLTLQKKVDDATRRLSVANEKLKALDETKDDFISMASHQLRTPLTSIKGYLSMVLEGDVGSVSKQQKEMLNLAFTSSQRMVYIIADLLNVSRLKTGKFVIEKSTMVLPDIIKQEIEQVEETAKSREVKIEFKPPKDFPLAYLDETKTRQVIMNFIDNAIYYSRPKGKVEILLNDTPSAIEFRVKDNGLGVPKSDIPHLFTKFYRAANARKARPDGTGLGLFMAKKVVISQGGVIIFESQEGKGSTFGFRFSKSKIELPKSAQSATK